MSDPTASANYAREIREWLVGRVVRDTSRGSVAPLRERLPVGRILWWWIFEGKTYPWLDSSLGGSWSEVASHARRLLGTYNPRWSIGDSPEGETDWLSSAFHSITSSRPAFVSRANRPGLDDAERMALQGWIHWIGAGWDDYHEDTSSQEVEALPFDLPDNQESDREPSPHALRRWARSSKRSRWPLLRNVVSESIRAALDEQEIDRLPLPTDHATLFELVCMVRILRNLEHEPRHVRWLDPKHGSNRIETQGMTYAFQHSLSKSDVLDTSEFDSGLRDAMTRYEIRTPGLVDGWLQFSKPRAGFAGIVIEAKSGSQSYDAAVYQLKCYRAALRRHGMGRLVVWGITEKPSAAPLFDRVQDAPPSGGAYADDYWVFSSAAEIEEVLRGIGLASKEDLARATLRHRGLSSPKG